jgi:chemotaxis protein MotB
MNDTLELKTKEADNIQQEKAESKFPGPGEIRFSDLKAEIAANTGLILKNFPESSPQETTTPKLLSFLANIPANHQKAQFVKLLKKLKGEIVTLNKRIQAEQAERQAILREKSILIKEIKRLRGEPEKIKDLNKKIAEIEKRSRINIENNEILLKEKSKLVTAYEETLVEVSREKKKSEESERKYAELYSDLTVLQIEKENLQVDLNKVNRTFNQKLEEKAKKIEIEFESKVQYIRKQKKQVSNFSNEVMEDSETPAWMVTYGDMVTLLLTFFILYYSIAAQNVKKFQEVIMGDNKDNIGLVELLDTMTIKTSLNEWTGFQNNTLLDDMGELSSDQISLDSGNNSSRVVVRIPGRTLFKPGSADLEKSGWPALTKVADIFKKYPNYKINIQGHTDDYPISSESFPTNWELSAVRATAVLRFLNDKGIEPEKMTATGYADTFPLGPNTTVEERSKNRRVEFVLEKIK